mmetsp:Transcript_13395/g.39182  ORF Transcript_13395/g.39182 Transcript_13395/m.39182 type:complete len:133 (-) Transcript_13395:134-532(-)
MTMLKSASSKSMNAIVSRFGARTAATTIAPRITSVRSVSSHATMAVEKFQSVFEEYRKRNYSQETPARFRKEIVKYVGKNKDGDIPVEGIELLLSNIGATGELTRSEIESILSESGEPSKMVISPHGMMRLL